MPVRGPIQAVTEVRPLLQKDAAAWRVNAEAKALKIPPPPKIAEKVQANLTPHLVNIARAIDANDPVSVQAEMAFKVYQKIQQDPTGASLTPQDLAIAHQFAEEAKGKPVVGTDGKPTTTPPTMIGGVADEKSPYYIKDPKAQAKALKDLDETQQDIEVYLTGEDVNKREQWWGEKHRLLKYRDPDARARAREALRMNEDYYTQREKLAQEKKGGRKFTDLTEAEQREISPQAQEAVVCMNAGSEVEALLVEVGGGIREDRIQDAKAHGSPEEILLAEKAEKIGELEGRILREKSAIRKFTSMDQLLVFLGANPADPTQAGILESRDVVETWIEYRNMPAAEADILRKDLNKAALEIVQDIPEFGSFVPKVFQRKLDQDAIARGHTAPAELQKKGKLELSDTAKGKITERHAAFAIMEQIGLREEQNPVDLLVNRFGIDRPRAQQLVTDACDHGLLVNGAGAKPTTGDKVKVNRDNIADWGNPSIWAEAVRLGHITPADLKIQLVAQQTAKGVNGAIADTEADKIIQDINNNYRPLLDGSAPKNAKADKVRAGKHMGKLEIAIALMAAGAGGGPMAAAAAQEMNTTDQQELMGELKS